MSRGILAAPGRGTGWRGRRRGVLDRGGPGPRLRGRRSRGHRSRGYRFRGYRLRGLLAVLGVAVGLTGCAGAGQDAPPERILRHGGEFAVGTFDPSAVRATGTAASQEGTLVVQDGCLALASSAPGDGTRAVAVPIGSSISERGTVYVADTGTGDAERAGGPVMAGHLGGQVRFTGPEVVLGGMEAQDLVMPPGCAAPGTRVLLVTP